MNVKDLKSYIKLHKIKYKTISEKSGIPVGTLRNIFSNSDINPRYGTIEKIEKALGIDGTHNFVQKYYTNEEEQLVTDYRNLSSKDKRLVSVIIKEMNDTKPEKHS